MTRPCRRSVSKTIEAKRQMIEEKPVLHLLKGEKTTADKLIAMCERLTGKQMSDDGKAKYRQALDDHSLK